MKERGGEQDFLLLPIFHTFFPQFLIYGQIILGMLYNMFNGFVGLAFVLLLFLLFPYSYFLTIISINRLILSLNK